jgi:hypothetical protein
MAELERQASSSESPDSEQANAEATRRSITSSALTSLLPIAAASGIVRANFNTPKISFYSPSGNLIQPEGSSPDDFSASTPGSPTTRISSYRNRNRPTAYYTLSATACSPPVRPTLIPMTTPPTCTSPLPEHLRHHHNYRRPERSQIESCESLIVPTPPVQGCGGVIRTHSFTLRSGTHHSPPKKTHVCLPPKRHRSTRSLVHDLRSDARFYKSRYIALAAQSYGAGTSQKSKPKPKKKATLHKRQTPIDSRSAAGNSTSKSYAPAALEHPRHKSALGPLAGHALRICFCQPYDGAGKAACMHARAHVTEDEVAARPIVMRHRDERGGGAARQMGVGGGKGPRGA